MDKEIEMIAEQLPYIEDEVINGVLCYTLDGETWMEYTKEQLTQMFLFEQRCLENVSVSYPCQ